MKTKTKGLIALIVVIVAAIYYYVTIPAINIHSTDTWGAVLFLIVIALIVKLFFYGFRNPAKIRISDLKESKILRAGVILLLVLGAVYFIGSILSSPIVNAKKYQKLMKVEQGNFTQGREKAARQSGNSSPGRDASAPGNGKPSVKRQLQDIRSEHSKNTPHRTPRSQRKTQAR